MSREIKFSYIFQHCETGRIFKKEYSLKQLQFNKTDILNLLGGYSIVAIRQYTGLKDKNGKEIYDGDILTGFKFIQQKREGGYEVIEQVQYQQGCFRCFGQSFWSYRCWENKCEVLWCEIGPMVGSESYYQVDEIEVIGNIYENPELLEQGDE